MRIVPCANLAGRRRNFDSARLVPAFVVAFQRLPVCEAKQAGAVGDLRWDLRSRPNRLVLRNQREPPAKCRLIGRVSQSQKVGSSVAESIAPGERPAALVHSDLQVWAGEWKADGEGASPAGKGRNRKAPSAASGARTASAIHALVWRPIAARSATDGLLYAFT